jgi:hypothetical protein
MVTLGSIFSVDGFTVPFIPIAGQFRPPRLLVYPMSWANRCTFAQVKLGQLVKIPALGLDKRPCSYVEYKHVRASLRISADNFTEKN